MSNADDFLNAFREPKSAAEKNDDFEQSTLSLVLRQLGSGSAAVKAQQRKLGPAFNFGWFNSRDVIPAYLCSHRVPRFHFDDLLFRPTKSEVAQKWLETAEEHPEHADNPDCPLIMVFKVFDYGRMVATAEPIPDITHVHVVIRGQAFNVSPFAGYFSTRYGSPLGDEYD